MLRTSWCVRYEISGAARPLFLWSSYEGKFFCALHHTLQRKSRHSSKIHVVLLTAGLLALSSTHCTDEVWKFEYGYLWLWVGHRRPHCWEQSRMENNWLLNSQDKGKISYVFSRSQELFAIKIYLMLCKRNNKAARVRASFLKKSCYVV